MKVKELMSKPAVICGTADPLNTAAHLMWQHDFGALPVVDDSGSVVGMITDRDICMSAYTRGIPLHEIPVSTAMAAQVVVCRPDDPLEAAEHLMRERKIRRIPVVDGASRPLGILSLNDLVRRAALIRGKNGSDQEVTRTLAAICEPRSAAQPARRTPRAKAAPKPPAAGA
jgi:CBS domain-containing protein